MRPPALSLAGVDPSGGAGLLLDIKIFQSRGLYGMGVATALTGQNSRGVSFSRPVEREEYRRGLELLREDFSLGGVKIGMLPDAGIVEETARFLESLPRSVFVVVDPVIRSGTGFPRMEEGALHLFQERILPRADLLTPNLPETEILSGLSIGGELELLKGGHALVRKTGGAVLVKGGHGWGTDYLFQGDRVWLFPGRLLKKDAHGTGCYLSSLLLALRLTSRRSLPLLVGEAKACLRERIQKSLPLGKGDKRYLEVKNG